MAERFCLTSARNRQPEAVQAAAPRVQAEWQLCGAKALLLMGQFFFERDDVKAQLPVAPTFLHSPPSAHFE